MWSLTPGIRHLNHGSFGAVPVEVQTAQSEWRSRWEANPTLFVVNELFESLARARSALALFLGASEDGLVFVRNASIGIAAVARSLAPRLEPGDEILVTNHEYNAVVQTLDFAARERGAVVRSVDVPFPLESPDQVTHPVLDSVTTKTRLVVVDHITSPTGLIFPIEEIVTELEPEVPVLVDGAHGPGQVSLDLTGLGASWYAGNLHKWVCAPKGAAFLSTRADHIDETVPTVISHAWNTPAPGDASRYQGLFDWTGTDDFTSWLVVPEVLACVGSLEAGGWPALMKRNHELALAAREVVSKVLDVGPAAPDEMVGSMFGVPLPDSMEDDTGGLLSPLNQVLLDDGFETLVGYWPQWPAQVLRLSAHHYNTLVEYEDLASHLTRIVV